MKIRIALCLCFSVGVSSLWIGCSSKQQIAQQAVPPVSQQDDARCLTRSADESKRDIVIGSNTWELRGLELSQKTAKAGEALRLGVLADIKEATAENLTNLREFVSLFKRDNADMIVVNGDTGESVEQIETIGAAIAESGLPVLMIIGNLEGRAAYAQALSSLQQRFTNVFDLNHVRLVKTAQATLVSLPGYHNVNFLHAKDGCDYKSGDVDALADLVHKDSSTTPVILISHGGPKQSGALATDRTSQGENAGDPYLASKMQALGIRFGIFGNIHEAGGRATNLAGDQVMSQNEMYTALYLNPGPVDAVRWSMNDGSESMGMAALMTVKDGKASYGIYHAPDHRPAVAAQN